MADAADDDDDGGGIEGSAMEAKGSPPTLFCLGITP